MNFKREGILINIGGPNDKTKAFCPDIIKISESDYFIYYVGTSCLPKERNGYRLLSAFSTDGEKFLKCPLPILDLADPSQKHYSPKVLKIENYYDLYYALAYKGKYSIRKVRSNSAGNFKNSIENEVEFEDVNVQSIHTPKIIFENGVYHCYFTASQQFEKIYSSKFPNHDFGVGFKIYYARSFDGLHFSLVTRLELIKKMTNCYGHNACLVGDRLYLVFSGFDGAINRLYITYSKDFIHFYPPQILLEPDLKNNEIGVYSNTILPISNIDFRLFFGIRTFDNYWRIHSGTFRL